MIKVRFKTWCEDYRPLNWPIKHPYWCTGGGDGYSIIVAYADSVEEIQTNWPDATDIDVFEENTKYEFTQRFQQPSWFSLEVK